MGILELLIPLNITETNQKTFFPIVQQSLQNFSKHTHVYVCICDYIKRCDFSIFL